MMDHEQTMGVSSRVLDQNQQKASYGVFIVSVGYHGYNASLRWQKHQKNPKVFHDFPLVTMEYFCKGYGKVNSLLAITCLHVS